MTVVIVDGFTVIVISCCSAHAELSGVNVYVPDAEVFTLAGNQVPEMPF
jgi:hypothetical protein